MHPCLNLGRKKPLFLNGVTLTITGFPTMLQMRVISSYKDSHRDKGEKATFTFVNSSRLNWNDILLRYIFACFKPFKNSIFFNILKILLSCWLHTNKSSRYLIPLLKWRVFIFREMTSKAWFDILSLSENINKSFECQRKSVGCRTGFTLGTTSKTRSTLT